ncbi:MAG: GRP family sugar transporter [Alphaproteobacteria bacterium]|nr:GRP family sugar transporter [Alphaproteobacteria bacterium]
MGYVWAITASIFYALYVVPRKFSRAAPEVYTYFVGLGFFAFAFLNFIIDGASASFADVRLFATAGQGVAWAFGTILFMIGIDKVGLVKSRQWHRAIAYPGGILLSLLILREHSVMNMFWFGLAFATVLIAALLFTIREGETVRELGRGIWFSIAAALVFSICSPLQKIGAPADLHAQQLVFSASIFITIALWLVVRRRPMGELLQIGRRDNLLAISGGVMYTFASIFTIQAYRLMTASLASTILQLMSVWSILIGIIWFKEISWSRHKWRIVAGTVATVAAILLTLKV